MLLRHDYNLTEKYMNIELLNLLGNVNDNSLVGLSIQHALDCEREEELLYSLKSLAHDYPQIILTIIGEKAFDLLKQ